MRPFPAQELKALVLLNRLGSPRAALPLLREGHPPGEILEMLRRSRRRDRAEGWDAVRSQFDAGREIETCLERGIHLVPIWDRAYPVFLREITDPPLLLYVLGTLEPADAGSLAVVGSRRPSLYGLTQTRRFSFELASRGLTIVSGFARGVDTQAHQAALEVPYGRTCAVLGCGLDLCYPRENRILLDRIRERGAVVSEYALGTPPLAVNFPRRNRIIAGLSLGVLVMEAHARSGSLITAHEAAEQGREVFAVPGPVDQLTSKGTHALIKEGALLVESPAEVLEALAPMLCAVIPHRPVPAENETKKSAAVRQPSGSCAILHEESDLLKIMENGPLAYEEILSRQSAGPGKAMALLTRLELEGRIRRDRNGRFAIT